MNNVKVELKNPLPEIQKLIDTYQLDEGWYDLWHKHFDWEAWAYTIKRHKELINHMLILYNRICQQAKNLGKPWQSWVYIEPENSSQDSIYLHTPNPNKNNFPLDYSQVTWNVQVPNLLNDIPDKDKYLIGEMRYKNVLSYWIKLK